MGRLACSSVKVKRVSAPSDSWISIAVITPSVVARCHALGAPVLVWTVDDPELVPWLDRLGVDGVVTNDPRIFGG